MKQNKGITLVALVITIIVLLILAGVSISLVLGENGILGKATLSSTATKIAQVSEGVQRALSSVQTDYYYNKYVEENGTATFEAFLKEKLVAALTDEHLDIINGTWSKSGDKIVVGLDGAKEGPLVTITVANSSPSIEVGDTLVSTGGTVAAGG